MPSMKLNKVQEGERIIGKLPDNLKPALMEADYLFNQGEDLAQRLLKLKDLYTAKLTIFWDEYTKTNEMAETAHKRGMIMSVRVDDQGETVVVESKSVDPLIKLRKLLE